ncbi:hypothetical protein NLI96_g7101 [Meripilus lineatus]|uniref:Thioredoxin domain-containing protein n=1 Tax=Meripilus lineatus TaxID=2056292 RepID=A0AAD5V222_9APHY|nr:hypothetical protein NLI96_g7101 [Physisporinus lineatus]
MVIDGYPQMNLYRDGVYVETFEEPRDYDTLVEYLSKHAERKTPSGTSQETTSQPHPEAPADGATPHSNNHVLYNPTGTVTSLNEATFADLVNAGHVFVKFFAPWCGHCKKLAPSWIDLARQMKNKLNVAEVNCDEHSALCRSQGVSGYPMLFYYSGKKGSKTEYTGGRKLDQLRAFAERISLPPVQPLGSGELPQIVAENPVVYLLLQPSTDQKALTVTTDSSQVLFGTPPVYVTSSSAIYDHYSVDPASSTIIALKDHEMNAAASFFTISHGVGEKEKLTSWMLRNRLPTSTELDSDSFQEVMNAPHKPLVVIVAAPTNELETTAESVRRIASQWKDSKAEGDVIFTWMDAGRWSSWLKNMYGVKENTLPRVILANHSRLIYYSTDQIGNEISLTATSVLSAINGAIHGTIPFKHSENIVERFARLVYVVRRFAFDETEADFTYRKGDMSGGKKTSRLD